MELLYLSTFCFFAVIKMHLFDLSSDCEYYDALLTKSLYQITMFCRPGKILLVVHDDILCRHLF